MLAGIRLAACSLEVECNLAALAAVFQPML